MFSALAEVDWRDFSALPEKNLPKSKRRFRRKKMKSSSSEKEAEFKDIDELFEKQA